MFVLVQAVPSLFPLEARAALPRPMVNDFLLARRIGAQGEGVEGGNGGGMRCVGMAGGVGELKRFTWRGGAAAGTDGTDAAGSLGQLVSVGRDAHSPSLCTLRLWQLHGRETNGRRLTATAAEGVVQGASGGEGGGKGSGEGGGVGGTERGEGGEGGDDSGVLSGRQRRAIGNSSNHGQNSQFLNSYKVSAE